MSTFLILNIKVKIEVDAGDTVEQATEYLEGCIKLSKINDEFIEYIQVKVVGVEESKASCDTEFFDNCDREGEQK